MRHPLRNLSIVSTALVIGLCTPSSASAANVAPNPGFEDACGSAMVACFWDYLVSETDEIRRDPSIAHRGAASYRLRVSYPPSSNVVGQLAASDCVNTQLPAGSIPYSYWYVTTDAVVGVIRFQLNAFSGAGCSGTRAASSVEASPIVRDGSWHQVSGTTNLAFSAQSFNLYVYFFCTDSSHLAVPCGTAQVNYDDLAVGESPTVAGISSIRAERTGSRVVLRWRTASEARTLGFNVYRQRHGKLVRLNRALIPSVFGGTTSGHAYSWLDRSAPKGSGKVRYRLQAVNLDGTRSWVGSVLVAR